MTLQTLLPLKRLPSKSHLLQLQQATLVLQSTHQLIQLQGAINLVRFNLHKFKYGSYNIDFEANFQKLENPFLRLRSGHWLILLIIKECSMLEQTIWPSNHTSNTKVYINEFVANVLHGNIGIVNFDLWGHGGWWRPKTPLGGQKWHEGVNLVKKVFNQSFSTTS